MGTPLRELFRRIRKTGDPAAGLANEFLVQLIRREDRGIPFRSLKEARCHCEVALLLDLKVITSEKEVLKNKESRIVIRLSDSIKRKLKNH